MEDIWGHIIQKVNGIGFKTIQLISKWHYAQTKKYPHVKARVTDHLLTLVNMFPDYNWNCSQIEYRLHKKIDKLLDLMKKFPNKAWSYSYISQYASSAIIDSNPTLRWVFSVIVCNANIDLYDAFRYAKMYNCIDEFSSNKKLTWELIISNIDLRWNWYDISRNPMITFDIVQSRHDLPWNIKGLSGNVNISFEIMLAHPEFEWDWREASCKCPIWYISENMNISWNWFRLSQQYAESPEIIFKYQHLPWDWNIISTYGIPGLIPVVKWDWLSRNSKLTLDYISSHSDKLTFKYLSTNSNLTYEFINANLDKDWDWTAISAHKCITTDHIDANPTWPWSLNGIAQNPNITWEYVVAHLELFGV